MKIVSAKADLVNLPADDPLGETASNPGARRPFVTLTIETSDGLTGIAATCFGGALSGALKSAVEALSSLIIGDDPLRPEAVARKLRGAAGRSGPAGIFTLALSAIDIALWDIKAKYAKLPLWKLLGGARDRVPTYASGALNRDLSPDAVVRSAQTLIAKGFRQIKMQLALPGDASPRKEVERARIVRDAIGPDVSLMCDANQNWRVDQSIEIGRRLEDEGIGFFWLEDPASPEDFSGLARIAAALSTPITAGEYVYGITNFRNMIEARSVDIVMIDLLRVGGITQWLKVAGMAEASGLPVVSHLLPEIHAHLVAAVPNGLTVEYMPWSVRLFEEVTRPQNGELVLPSSPGLGLNFDRDAISRFKV